MRFLSCRKNDPSEHDNARAAKRSGVKTGISQSFFLASVWSTSLPPYKALPPAHALSPFDTERWKRAPSPYFFVSFDSSRSRSASGIG